MLYYYRPTGTNKKKRFLSLSLAGTQHVASAGVNRGRLVRCGWIVTRATGTRAGTQTANIRRCFRHGKGKPKIKTFLYTRNYGRSDTHSTLKILEILFLWGKGGGVKRDTINRKVEKLILYWNILRVLRRLGIQHILIIHLSMFPNSIFVSWSTLSQLFLTAPN